MERRMARIEAMMEALMQERGITQTPIGSIEREEAFNEGYRGSSVHPLPFLDPINPALTQMDPGQDVRYGSHDWTQPSPTQLQALTASDPHVPAEAVRVGNRTLSFPGPDQYRQYLTTFFSDLHFRHPCINEDHFRSLGGDLLGSGIIQPEDTFLLALHYIIFACCDILVEPLPSDPASKPGGWNWYLLADSLYEKSLLFDGPCDLLLLQLLL